ncbi:MAG: hypothetical protein HZB16_11375 [Armatimonadetes bacterium]|nr:hypothetical protein [Armatimonadota bacterium]
MSLLRGRRPHRARWALTATLCLAGLATAAQARSVRPYVVRLTLCGWRVGATKFGALHDAGSGYYLIATGDCDGASRSLIPTPDPPEWTKPSPVTQTRLSRLRTGTGVNIGDTVSVVAAKLGARPDSISNDRETG